MASCKEATYKVRSKEIGQTNKESELLVKRVLNIQEDYRQFLLKNNQKPGSSYNMSDEHIKLLKFSLTICLSSDDPSMRSLARSVLFDMFGYHDTDCHGRELKKKLENLDLSQFAKSVQELKLSNKGIIQQVVTLFQSSFWVS